MVIISDIDIEESILRKRGNLLDLLLLDRTTKKNIIWGTDSYEHYGKDFSPKKCIAPDLITGLYSKLIQPRAAKSFAEQRQRTREKAEVFTPLRIVDQINKQIDWSSDSNLPDGSNWQKY